MATTKTKIAINIIEKAKSVKVTMIIISTKKVLLVQNIIVERLGK